MKQTESTGISRRVLAKATLSVAAALIGRRQLFAVDEGIVPQMVDAAAKAKINIRPIRRNISVLEGSGGNIAVLTGRDGKLLVDAGFAVSRAAITNALTSINADPIKHLINTHWHTDHTDGNAWLHSAGAAITAASSTPVTCLMSTSVPKGSLSCHSCLCLPSVTDYRHAHNPKVVGSNPTPATNRKYVAEALSESSPYPPKRLQAPSAAQKPCFSVP